MLGKPQRPSESRRSLPPALAAVPTVISVMVASWIMIQAWPTWSTDCDVQMSPYLTKVEIDGWKAGALCERLIANHAAYRYRESSPDGPVICEQNYDGYRVSVYHPDAGVVGAVVCAALPTPSAGIDKVVA